MKFVALIPARGGSKGIPRKNILDLGGRPLIAWTIEAALSSGVFDKILVSTDDKEIAEVAQFYGAQIPFIRPSDLATDEASSLSVARHAVEWYANVNKGSALGVILLQPTSPFRTAIDIRNAANLATENAKMEVANIVSLTPSTHDPRWTFQIDSTDFLYPVFAGDRSPRRQDTEKIYHPNGAIYISSISNILFGGSWYDDPVKGYVMPEERSIDIDSPFGLEIARALALRFKQ